MLGKKGPENNLLVGEVDTLLDATRELNLELGQPIGFVLGNVADGHDFLSARRAETDLSREVRKFRDVGSDVRTFVHVRFTTQTAQASFSHARSGISHGERRGAGASLGFDDFGAGVLNAHGELISLFGGEVALRVRLAQKRQNRNASVATDDGNVDVVNVQPLGFCDERVRANDVERRDAENLLRIVASSLLEHLARDRDRGVHRVGDDVDQRVRARFGARDAQVANDAGVNREQIVSRHARLTRNARGNNHQIGTLERILQLIRSHESTDLARRVRVRQIRRHARRIGQVVQSQVANQRIHLQQE